MTDRYPFVIVVGLDGALREFDTREESLPLAVRVGTRDEDPLFNSPKGFALEWATDLDVLAVCDHPEV